MTAQPDGDPWVVTPEAVASTAPDEADNVVPPPLDAPGQQQQTLFEDEPAATLPIAKVRRYQQLRSHQAASEAEMKGVKEEADLLEQELVDAFSEAGVRNLSVDGQTVYLHRSVYAKRKEGVDTDTLKAALRAAGMDDLIGETVNANTLSAYVREQTEDEDAPGLPAPIAAVLEPGERFGVRINAAGSRPKSKTKSK